MKKQKKNFFLSNLLKFFLGLLIVLIILIAAVFVWQRDNIMSLYKGTTSSSEDIATEIADQKAKANEALAEYETPVLRDFTLEEEEMIRKGELSVDEALKRIMDESAASELEPFSPEPDAEAGASGSSGDTEVSDTKADSGAGSGSISDPEHSGVVDADKLVGDAVRKMYALKAYYIGRLGSLESEIKSEYKALPPDKRGKKAVSSIVSSHMGEASGLESECDSRVGALLSQLEADLSSAGADTSIVSTLQNEYQNEKNLRKSYYVSSYTG